MPAPPFGTASAYADSFPAAPPRSVTVSAETCFNLGVFKDVVRQYRKLDDQVIIRLNRASAQLRDQDRTSKPSSSWSGTAAAGSGIEGMCTTMWKEMMSGWAHRQTMLTYCLSTVNASLEARRDPSVGIDSRLAEMPKEARDDRRQRGIREEEALAEQLANEETIEAIIRKRTLDAFKSRCPFFYPPTAEKSGREWWDLADSGRRGRGPDISP